MNSFFRGKGRRLAAALAAGLVLAMVFVVLPSQAGPCEKALGKCLLSVGLGGLIGAITGSIVSAALMGEFCAGGYAFCVQYCI